MDLTAEQQRELGKDISRVLDRYGVQSANRVWVLVQAVWGEAQNIGMSPVVLGTHALTVWKEEPETPSFYRR